MSYSYTNGDGTDVIDPATPAGSEPVSVVDQAIRQIKAWIKDPVAGYLKLAADVQALSTAIGGIDSGSSFGAFIGTNQTRAAGAGPVVIQFNTESFDPDSVFAVGTYEFSAPRAGVYLFNVRVRLDTTASSSPTDVVHILTLQVNTNPVAISELYVGASTNGRTMELVSHQNLAVGAKVRVTYEATINTGSATFQLTADSAKSVFQGSRTS